MLIILHKFEKSCWEARMCCERRAQSRVIDNHKPDPGADLELDFGGP